MPTGGEVRCTCSIGVASLPPGEASGGWDRILDEADRALYAAKGGGRNRVMFADEPAVPPGASDFPRAAVGAS